MNKEYDKLFQQIIYVGKAYNFINELTFKLFEDRLLKAYESDCKKAIKRLA